MRTFNGRWGLLALVSFLLCPTVTRAELANINLTMTATLVASTCEVSAASKELFVSMGSWPTKQFSNASRSVAPAQFTINLENCSNLKNGVSVMFSGIADVTDPTLLSIRGSGSAQNLAIAILNEGGSPIPLGEVITIPGPTNGSHSAALVFFGQYRATGTQVTAGLANADATFTLSYE